MPNLMPSRVALCLSLLCAGSASAQEARFLTYENDDFFDTDRHYTNGIQFSTGHAQDTRSTRERDWTERWCRWFGCAGDTLLFTQNNLGQLMYTPSNIETSRAQPHDRPYAGYLYRERAYLFLSPDEQVLTILAAQAGVTGRLSLAEQAQKLVHRLVDRPQPRGWNHQVGNSLAFVLSAERRIAWPFLSGALGGGMQLRTNVYGRVAVGTVMSYVAGGISLAVGKNLPAVSPMPPGITHRMHRGTLGRSCMWSWVQCTVFAGVEGRWVGYNLFVQGRPWQDDPGVKPRRVVGDLIAGLRLDFPGTRGLEHGPWFIQFKATRRAREFYSLLPVARHTVGALTLGTDF